MGLDKCATFGPGRQIDDLRVHVEIYVSISFVEQRFLIKGRKALKNIYMPDPIHGEGLFMR